MVRRDMGCEERQCKGGKIKERRYQRAKEGREERQGEKVDNRISSKGNN